MGEGGGHEIWKQHVYRSTIYGQDCRSAAESRYGARYSELLRLPYFDCVRFTIVDPMHNLFLGTAKHLMEVWLELSTLSANSSRQS